jgi:hypothetical protein
MGRKKVSTGQPGRVYTCPYESLSRAHEGYRWVNHHTDGYSWRLEEVQQVQRTVESSVRFGQISLVPRRGKEGGE